jgi:clan AA aspartic protease (TIGR02281 family)
MPARHARRLGAAAKKAAEMKNWAMKQLLVWGGLALLLALVLPRILPQPQPHAPVPRTNPALVLPAPTSAPLQYAAPDEQVFPADGQGHVYLDALVNGAPVHFLVDTGATLVSLTMADAKTVGVNPDRLAFRVPTSTANGTASAASVTLHEIRIGQIPVFDVPALVHQNLGISLLGQSFLTRLRSYNMQNGQLTLEWN